MVRQVVPPVGDCPLLRGRRPTLQQPTDSDSSGGAVLATPSVEPGAGKRGLVNRILSREQSPARRVATPVSPSVELAILELDSANLELKKRIGGGTYGAGSGESGAASGVGLRQRARAQQFMRYV